METVSSIWGKTEKFGLKKTLGRQNPERVGEGKKDANLTCNTESVSV